MISFGDLGISLTSVTLMVSLLLAIAWIDFERPRHALTWSIGFGLLGLGWILAFFVAGVPGVGDGAAIALLVLIGAGIGLNTMGFRQRGGHEGSWRPILIAIGVQVLATTILFWRTRSVTVAALPIYLLAALMAWFSSAALIGRRKSERAAERVALYWLRAMALVSVALFAIGIAGSLDGAGHAEPLRFIQFAPLLPAMITGVGLFAIFLLTADLADQSRRLAGTDMLTGLLNRRGFDDAAAALLGSAQRNERRLCLAVIDIDRFKDVNDRFGHLAGDEVLRRFAGCMSAHVGSRDILARVGGEEFALILADRDCEDSRVLLEDARGAIAACQLNLPGDHRVTASFGLAPLGLVYDLPSLFAAADRALYAAKSSGRNQVVVAG